MHPSVSIRVGPWLTLLFTIGLAFDARAETFRTQDEALAIAFPGAEITRRAEALTKEQASEVAKRSGDKPSSLLVFAYEARIDGKLVGTAYFDAHLVRTLPETLMIVVDPSGRIARIDVLAFNEPKDYLAPERWLEQFPGRELDDELHLRRGIDGISGATLTARAVTKTARRILAVHQVLSEPADE
jgi:hypothetical protein